MSSMAALCGPRWAAFYEALLAPLLNPPRINGKVMLCRATGEAGDCSPQPYSHFANVLYRVEPRGAVTRVTASCSGIRVGEPIDTLLYYAVAPQPARPCSQFPACARPTTPHGPTTPGGAFLMPCAVCQFHLSTAPETWLACGACPPAGRLGRLSELDAAWTHRVGPLLTPGFLEQLRGSRPCRAKCDTTTSLR